MLSCRGNAAGSIIITYKSREARSTSCLCSTCLISFEWRRADLHLLVGSCPFFPLYYLTWDSGRKDLWSILLLRRSPEKSETHKSLCAESSAIASSIVSLESSFPVCRLACFLRIFCVCECIHDNELYDFQMNKPPLDNEHFSFELFLFMIKDS